MAAASAAPPARRGRSRRPARRRRSTVWKRIGIAPEISPARTRLRAPQRQGDADRRAGRGQQQRLEQHDARDPRSAARPAPAARRSRAGARWPAPAAGWRRCRRRRRGPAASAPAAAPARRSIMRCGPRGGSVKACSSARTPPSVSGCVVRQVAQQRRRAPGRPPPASRRRAGGRGPCSRAATRSISSREPSTSTGGHRRRQPQIEGEAERRALEARRRHADDHARSGR